MSFVFDFTLEEEVLIVRAEGIDNCYEDVKHYIDSIVQIANANGITNILVDDRLRVYTLSYLAYSKLANHMKSYSQQLDKVVVVCSSEYKFEKELFEGYITKPGVNFRFSFDYDEAKNWIRNGEF